MNLPRGDLFSYAQKIEYIYDANGTKKRKSLTYYPNDGGLIVLKTDHIEYTGGFQYKNGGLQFFPTAEGYVRNTQGALNHVFQYRDHLGNIRLSYAENPVAPGTASIIEENHYYPFGLKHANYNSDQMEFAKQEQGLVLKERPGDCVLCPPKPTPLWNNYKYNEKEFQDELGLNLYDYGARNYDPAIGRWMNMDALSEKYPNVSTYAYVANMPTIAVDPDGNEIILVTSSGAKLQYRNGNAYHYGTNKMYAANGNSTIDRTIRSYQKIEASNNKILTRTLHHLEKSDLKHTVYESKEGRNTVNPAEGSTFMDGSNERTDTDTYLDLSQERKDDLESKNGVPFTDLDIVAHEMGHQYDYDIGNMADSDVPSNSKSPTEIRAVHLENIARKVEGNKKRTTYGGKIDPKKLDNPPNFFPPIYFPEIKFSDNIFPIKLDGRHPNAN